MFVDRGYDTLEVVYYRDPPSPPPLQSGGARKLVTTDSGKTVERSLLGRRDMINVSRYHTPLGFRLTRPSYESTSKNLSLDMAL